MARRVCTEVTSAILWIAAALLLAAFGQVGRAQLLCTFDPQEGAHLLSGSDTAGVDVGGRWPSEAFVIFEGAEVANEDGKDALYNIDGQRVRLDSNTVITQFGGEHETAGVAASGSGAGIIENDGRIEVNSTGDFASGIRVGTLHPDGPLAANKTVDNHNSIIVAGPLSAQGITVYGHGHTVSNTGEIDVRGRSAVGIYAAGDEASVESSGIIDVLSEGATHSGLAVSATGIHVEGSGSTAVRTGTLNVRAAGGAAELARAAGMVILGDETIAVNAQDFQIMAESGGRAVALGLVAAGSATDESGLHVAPARNVTLYSQGFFTQLQASGNTAIAVGLAAVSVDSFLENNDFLRVRAYGNEAVAVGMAAVSGFGDINPVGGGNILRSAGDSWLSVFADGPGSNDFNRKLAERALAIGMFSAGPGGMLEHTDDTNMTVNAAGVRASATAIAVAGDDSSVNNTGTIIAIALGVHAEAAGIVAYGSGNKLVSPQGSIRVEVRGSEAEGERSGTGLVALGDSNTLESGGEVLISVYGNGAKATGIVAEGKGNVLNHHGGVVSVLTEGDDAAAIAMAAVSKASGAEDASIVSNTGELSVGVRGSGAGATAMAARGGHVHLRNDGGSISAAATGRGGYAAGIFAEGRSHTLNNDGSITVLAVGDAAVAAGIHAIAWGGPIDIHNAAAVQAQGNGSGAGARLTALDEGDEEAVLTLNNLGEIKGYAASAAGQGAGVVLGAGEPGQRLGTVLIHNEAGALIGGYTSEGSPDVAVTVENRAGTYQQVFVANKGTLEGDVHLRGQQTTMELHDGSKTYGDVLLDGATNTAVVYLGGDEGLDDGGRKYQLIGGETGINTLVLTAKETDDPARQGDMRGHMVNFHTIDIARGRWIVDQEGMGDRETVVRAGSTLVLTEPLVLGLKGRLGGNGTIEGTVINEAGTSAPGESRGKLTIDGDYVHGADATLEIEVLLIGSDANPDADVLEVTGTATLNGGTVLVVAEDTKNIKGFRGQTRNYGPILEAMGGIEGPGFSRVEAASPFLEPAVVVGSNSVTLEVSGLDSFVPLGRTPNERTIASMLDRMYDLNRGEELIDAVYSITTAGAVRQAFNSLSGEVYTAFPVISTAAIDRFAEAVLRGMDHPEAADGSRGWVAAYGTTGKLDGDDDNAGADLKVTGGAAGLHVLAGPSGRVGFTAGFAHSKVDMEERGSTLTGDGYQLGVYGQTDLGRVRMTGLFVHSRTRYDGERKIAFGAGDERISRTARGEFDGTQLLASVRGEWLRGDEGSVSVRPVFGLSWLSTSRSGFGEEGAGEADLQVERYAESYVRGDVGVQVGMRPLATRGGWVVNPALRVAYVHDFSAPSRDVTVRMGANLDDARTIRGVEPGESGFQMSLGLSGFRPDDDRFGWNVRYEGEFRSDVQTHALQGGLSLRF